MNKLFVLPALALAAGFSVTTPSLAATSEQYMAACMGASGDNTVLCTCKTEQAVKLADEIMMDYIITYMQDSSKFREMVNKGEVPEAVVKQWPIYVMKSSLVCSVSN